MVSLKAKVKRRKNDVITLEIKREDFEAFCSAAGLYCKDFSGLLEASMKDHKAGRVTERESLCELIED